VAPIPKQAELEYSGCPALMKWLAAELGVSDQKIQIWVENTLASPRDIRPCDTCAKLKDASTILVDIDGTYVEALARVVNEFASSNAPPTEEQMASIANAMARHSDDGSYYALAGNYIDALAEYIATLNDGVRLPIEESITIAADKYIKQIVEGNNAALSAYLTSRLTYLSK